MTQITTLKALLVEEKGKASAAQLDKQKTISEMERKERDWQEKMNFLIEVEHNFEYLKLQVCEYEDRLLNLEESKSSLLQEKEDILTECRGLREQLRISRSSPL